MIRTLIRNILKPLSFLPAILMMYLIFSFSAQDGVESSQLSYKVSYKIVEVGGELLGADFDSWEIESLANRFHGPVRKIAHMTEYFALAVSVAFPLYVYGLRGIWLMLVAGIFCVAFACADEYHQAFVNGRGPSKKDVLIDSIGVFFGIILVRIVGWTGRKTIFRPLSGKRKHREIPEQQMQTATYQQNNASVYPPPGAVPNQTADPYGNAAVSSNSKKRKAFFRKSRKAANIQSNNGSCYGQPNGGYGQQANGYYGQQPNGGYTQQTDGYYGQQPNGGYSQQTNGYYGHQQNGNYSQQTDGYYGHQQNGSYSQQTDGYYGHQPDSGYTRQANGYYGQPNSICGQQQNNSYVQQPSGYYGGQQNNGGSQPGGYPHQPGSSYGAQYGYSQSSSGSGEEPVSDQLSEDMSFKKLMHELKEQKKDQRKAERKPKLEHDSLDLDEEPNED